MTPSPVWRNWSGHQRCRPAAWAHPGTTADVADLVRACAAGGRRLRVAGAGHSFSGLVPTDQTLVRLDGLAGLDAVDREARRATVWGGTRLRALGEALHAEGLAMENLGDIDVQAIAGALSTGTHGTGTAFGTLSTQITGLELVDGTGTVRWLSAQTDPEAFALARVGLGALGVITRLELGLVPAYRLTFRTGKGTLDEALRTYPEHNAAHRNYEFYWFPYADRVQHKFSDRTEAPAVDPGAWDWFTDVFLENRVFGLMCRTARVFPGLAPALARLSAAAVSTSSRTNWSHRVYATPRLVRFQEMEYNVPVEAFPDVVRLLRERLHRERFPVHFPIECRFVAADDIGLSPAFGRASAYIAVHQYHAMPWEDYFGAAQEIFLAHEGRPHWGKWHDLSAAELAPRYPRWNDFLALRERLDPGGVFLNPHLERVFGLGAPARPGTAPSRESAPA